MAQKTKRVDYNCNNYCRICDVEVFGKVKLGNYNIFTGKKAKDAQIAERLAKILECDLQQSNCSSIICIKCYRTMEKLEKAKEILTKELPNFKISHDQTCLSHSERTLQNKSRLKRCHTDSPLSAEKPSKQRVHSEEVRNTKAKAKLVFSTLDEPAQTLPMAGNSSKTNYSTSDCICIDKPVDQILGCLHCENDDDTIDPLPSKRTTVVKVIYFRMTFVSFSCLSYK